MPIICVTNSLLFCLVCLFFYFAVHQWIASYWWHTKTVCPIVCTGVLRYSLNKFLFRCVPYYLPVYLPLHLLDRTYTSKIHTYYDIHNYRLNHNHNNISKHTIKYHQIPSNTIKYHQIPSYSIKKHPNAINYHQIPSNTTK